MFDFFAHWVFLEQFIVSASACIVEASSTEEFQNQFRDLWRFLFRYEMSGIALSTTRFIPVPDLTPELSRRYGSRQDQLRLFQHHRPKIGYVIVPGTGAGASNPEYPDGIEL
jgi:hypothetical protein